MEPELLSQSFMELITNVGSPPFLPKVVTKEEEAAAATPAKTTTVTKSIVLSDGTYATQVRQHIIMPAALPPILGRSLPPRSLGFAGPVRLPRYRRMFAHPCYPVSVDVSSSGGRGVGALGCPGCG